MHRRAFLHALPVAALAAGGCDRKRTEPGAGSAMLAADAPVDPAFSSCKA